MFLYKVISEDYLTNRRRLGPTVNTEMGRMQRFYTGAMRVIQNRFTKKQRVQEECVVYVTRASELTCEADKRVILKMHWIDIRE